jgi:hypothetical protein
MPNPTSQAPIQSAQPTPPADVSLLLRSHAEQRWLSREVVAVLRQVERPTQLPEDQHDAAIAYLEVMWLEAKLYANETDAAYDNLDFDDARADDECLYHKALRYYSAARVLREVVFRRVAPFLAAASSAADSP